MSAFTDEEKLILVKQEPQDDEAQSEDKTQPKRAATAAPPPKKPKRRLVRRATSSKPIEVEAEELEVTIGGFNVGKLSIWQENGIDCDKHMVERIVWAIGAYSNRPIVYDVAHLSFVNCYTYLMMFWEKGTPTVLNVALISCDFRKHLKAWLEYEAPSAPVFEHFNKLINIMKVLVMPDTFSMDWDDKFAPMQLANNIDYPRERVAHLLRNYM